MSRYFRISFLTNEKDGNLAGIFFQLAMWCFMLLYITKVNLNDPFDYDSFKRVSIIGTLYIISFVLNLAGALYSHQWFLDRYHPVGREAGLTSTGSGLGIFTVVMIVAFYRIAAYNQQQLVTTRSV